MELKFKAIHKETGKVRNINRMNFNNDNMYLEEEVKEFF